VARSVKIQLHHQYPEEIISPPPKKVKEKKVAFRRHEVQKFTLCDKNRRDVIG